MIDARTVELHYQFHHKPAVANANKAEDALAHARDAGDFALVKHYERSWHSTSPAISCTRFIGLTCRLRRQALAGVGEGYRYHFGSFDKFKAHLIAATTGVEGAGWGILDIILALGNSVFCNVKPSEINHLGRGSAAGAGCGNTLII